MKTKILLFTFLLLSLKMYSQDITDSQIAKSLLNKHYIEINNTLDSLGVWYKLHVTRNFTENRQRIYSISNSNGGVKVYTLKIGGNDFESAKIERIIINYSHHSKQQIEDLMKLKGFSDTNVGTYSTDVIFIADN